MRSRHSVQMDGHGNFVEPDQESGVETAAEHEKRMQEAASSVAINPNSGFFRVQVGAAKAEEERQVDAKARIERLYDQLNLLQSQTDAGRPPIGRTLERLQHELNDIAIAYVAGGGSENSPALVQLREQVAAVARDARQNLR